MRCFNCNAENRPIAKFCVECGNSFNLNDICDNCGKQNRPGSRFCISCGSRIGLKDEFKADSYSQDKFKNLIFEYDKRFPRLKTRGLAVTSVFVLILIVSNIDFDGIKDIDKKNHDNQTQSSPAAPTEVQPQTSTQNIENTLPNAVRAIKDVFGVDAPTGQFKSQNSELVSIWFEQTFQCGNNSIHVVFLKSQELDKSGAVEGGRSTAPSISAATYKKANNDWQFISKQVNFTSIGQFGDAPEIKEAEITRVSTDKIVFLVNSGYSAQGITETGKILIFFDKIEWKNVGFIITDSDNSGTCGPDLSPCYKFSGELSFSSDNKAFPDVLVKKAGSELDGDRKVVVAGIDTYVFDGNNYELIENKKSNSSEEPKGNQNIKNMLDGSVNQDEQKILDNKFALELGVKPPRGDTKNARKYNDEALVLLKNNQFEEASELFASAHELDPSDIEITDNYAYALLKANKLKEAKTISEDAIAMNPGRATTWATLGQVLALQGKINEATASFSIAYRFSKNRLKTHQFFKDANKDELSASLKQARTVAIVWAEKTYEDINSLTDVTNVGAGSQIGAPDNPKQSSSLSSYIQAIANKVNNSWIRSPYFTRGLKCHLQVKLLPGGTVEDVIVTQSSGDPTFDRSAENAVRKASPLPIPNDGELFNQNFRIFTFEFSPD